MSFQDYQMLQEYDDNYEPPDWIRDNNNEWTVINIISADGQ